MPLYSLKCNNCNFFTEVICHVPKDKVRRRCPVCGKMMVRDWSKDGIQVKCDHDTTTGDIERNLEKPSTKSGWGDFWLPASTLKSFLL